MYQATPETLPGVTEGVTAPDAGFLAAAHAAIGERQEQERLIHLSQQLLAPAVAAASRTASRVDVVPLISGLSGIRREDVEAGLTQMVAGGVVQVIGEDDPHRAGRLRIAPTEIGLTVGYRVLNFDVGGGTPLPRTEIIDLVEAQDTANVRDGAGQHHVDLRIAAAHEIYFPQPLPVTAQTAAPQPALAA